MVSLKATALRTAFFALGVVTGIGLFLFASLILAVLGYGGGYALYNGYFLSIALWGIAAAAAYFVTRSWEPGKRLNLGLFMVGVVILSLIGGLTVLFTTPQFLMFPGGNG